MSGITLGFVKRWFSLNNKPETLNDPFKIKLMMIGRQIQTLNAKNKWGLLCGPVLIYVVNNKANVVKSCLNV